MQAVEIGQRQEQVAVERLEPAAGVAGAVAQDRAAHAVGDPRLKFLEPGRLAPDTLAGNQAHARRASFERFDQLRDESRIVLAVAVDA